VFSVVHLEAAVESSDVLVEGDDIFNITKIPSAWHLSASGWGAEHQQKRATETCTSLARHLSASNIVAIARCVSRT